MPRSTTVSRSGAAQKRHSGPSVLDVRSDRAHAPHITHESAVTRRVVVRRPGGRGRNAWSSRLSRARSTMRRMSTPRRKADPSTWGVSTLQLQRPDHLYFDGAVRPWDEGVLHVSTEAVVRGLNVFEGLKGYWQESGELAFRTLQSPLRAHEPVGAVAAHPGRLLVRRLRVRLHSAVGGRADSRERPLYPRHVARRRGSLRRGDGCRPRAHGVPAEEGAAARRSRSARAPGSGTRTSRCRHGSRRAPTT